MIKSKRKSIVFSNNHSRKSYALDKTLNSEYGGMTKNFEQKWVVSNHYVVKSNYPVKKVYKQGLDLADV